MCIAQWKDDAQVRAGVRIVAARPELDPRRGPWQVQPHHDELNWFNKFAIARIELTERVESVQLDETRGQHAGAHSGRRELHPHRRP